jgi:hypothetical protein
MSTYHATSQLATSQYGSDEQPSTEQVPPRQFSLPRVKEQRNRASGLKDFLSLCETNTIEQAVKALTSLCSLCKVSFHWTERSTWVSV